MSCKRCGNCCIYVALNAIDKNDGMVEFLRYHGCQAFKTEKGIKIRIPIVCKFLVYDNGQYACAIYDKRPEVCRHFDCKKTEE